MSESFSLRGVSVLAAAVLWAAVGCAQSVPALPDASDLHHDLAADSAALQPLESPRAAAAPENTNPQMSERSPADARLAPAAMSKKSQRVAGKYDLRRIGQRGVGNGLD